MGTGTFLKRQAIVLGLWVIALLSVISPTVAQVYLTEGFETAFTGNPAAPAGWTQSRVVNVGDGRPEANGTAGDKDWQRNVWSGTAWSLTTSGTTPSVGARTGSGVLYMNDAWFGNSSSYVAGNRRLETPTVNLAASTSPYVRFWMFCQNSSTTLNLRVVASADNGATWQTLQWVPSGLDSTTTGANVPYDRINVLVPPAFRVATAKFGIEVTGTYGTNDIFIDDFSIEEFTPTTITAIASGNWNSQATWGGPYPTSDNHVVIPAGITVSANVNMARVQDVTIDGTLQYSSTTATLLLHIQGNLLVNAGGTYFSGNGTTGKRTYLSGNLDNGGTVNFSPGTSALGALYWVGGGQGQTFNSTGTVNAGRIPIVYHANPAGVTYNSPLSISNTCGLVMGNVVHNGNLTFGGAPATATTHIVYRMRGTLATAATYNNTNITRFTTQYNWHVGTTTIWAAWQPTTIQTGEELPATNGGFTLNTFDHVELSRPTLVDGASSAVAFTRGILITSATNLLTLGTTPTGSTGSLPTTTIPSNNQGSYVIGPVKINFPTTGTTTRNFPLGQGAQFNPVDSTLSTNARRQISLACTGSWTGTEVTAEIVGRPSGPVNSPLTAVIGTRAYKITQAVAALPASATVQLNGINVANSLSDSLVGDVAGLRVAQAAALTGPWTERSNTTGTGALVTGTTYTRTTVATNAPGPISTDEFFAFATASPLGNLTINAILFPQTGSSACNGVSDSVVVRISNQGAGTTNFAVDTFVVTAQVTGPNPQTITRVVRTGSLAPGASMTVNIGNVNLGGTGLNTLRTWVKQRNDPDAANDSSGVLFFNRINTFPSLQNFEGFTSGNGSSTVGVVRDGWSNVTGDDFDWFVFNGSTTSSNTGPTVDKTLGTSTGKYMYLETSSTNSTPTKTAILVSPCLDFTSNASPRLTFWYHMAGSTMGTLNVDVFSGGSWTTVFSLSGPQQPTEASPWRLATVSLGAYGGQVVKVRFRGVTGSDFNGDMAIDDIEFSTNPPVDLTVSEFISPTTVQCFSTNQTVTVRVTNAGSVAQSNIPVTVQVTGAATATLSGTIAGPLAPSASTTFQLPTTFNMTAQGAYNFTCFVGQPGDASTLNDTLRASRTAPFTFPAPYTQNFDGTTALTMPQGWIRETASSFDFNNRTTFGSPAFAQGAGGTGNALAANVYSTNPFSFAFAPTVRNVPANAVLSFDYRFVVYDNGPLEQPLAPGDTLFIDISTDCGQTFQDFATIHAGNHTNTVNFTKFSRCLDAFAGQDVMVRFFQSWGAGDYIIAIDNFDISVPAAPTASGVSRCGAASVTLNATGSGVGTLNWYATRTSTTSLATGASYTASFTNSDSVFVAEVVGACGGLRRRVDVTINPIPAGAIVPTPAAICSGSTATFTPTPVSGVTFLYFSAPGGTQLGSGASYTTGPLTSNFSVFVDAVQGPCTTSSMTPITVTVNPLPAAPTVPQPATTCAGSNSVYIPTPASGVSFLYFDAPTGGTQLGSGASYVTPILFSDNTVYVAAVENGCTSATRTASTTTVFPIPPAATVPTPADICAGQTATFTPTPFANTNFLYFDAASGGNQLGSGASYTTGPLTNNLTVYVTRVTNQCPSDTRTAVTVTVNPLPATPTVPNPTAICGGNTATFTPTPSAGVTFLYFDAATGGTQLGSGASYTTGVLTADFTVHVAAVQNGCTSATRRAATVTVLPSPAAPTVPNPSAICAGATATFVPSFVAGINYLYFDAPTGGNQLGTGVSLTTSPLSNDLTIYVASVQNSCTSATRTAATVVVNQLPAAPTVPTPGAICSGQTATFTPTPSAGVSFLFFDAPTGGNVLGTSASYTTGTLTSNFTVHVVAVQNGCTSATRTASTVTVASSAPAPAVPTPAAVCNGSTATFTPTPAGGTTFTYWSAATGGTQLGSGASFTTGALTANFTVHVEAVQGTCTSSTRTASTVTVNSLPAAPIVPNPSAICSGNTATFTPFPSAGVSFVYFDAATGGTQLGSGASYTSGALTANLTVFTAAVQNGCTSATRSASTVTVNALPAAPTVPTPAAICSGSSTVFTPTPATGVSFLYFDAATGGAQLGSGASFTTGNLTADFTVHVAAVQNGCTSATRTASTVTVNALPANGGSLTTFVCGPGASLNVSVPNPVTGVTYNWYDAATGGNLVNTGTTYAWVSAGTITLHVEAVQNGCTSATRGVYQLDQRTVPAAPVAVGDTVCAGQNVIVTATASAGGTLTWWDAANGGAQLGNGTSLTLTAPTGSQTVYVQEELNGCTSARTAAEAGIQQIPAAPTAPDTVKICTNSTASLAATAPGTITWWDAASGGNLLFTGIQYTTSALTTNQSFFVQTEVNGCVSPRAEVFVEVGNTLGAPLARDTAICAGRTATLAALGSGTLSWYDAPTGGTALGTGFFYTTPALNSTDTFYVEAVQGTCVSARTPVVVTVNAAPVAFTVAGATTAVEATQETYTINNPETGVTYSWSVTGGTPASATGTSLQVTWGTPGAGTITIEGENANGCVVTTVVNVTINSATSVVPGLQTTFSMSQNYPNPSFDQTSIDVLLPSGQYGVISVFDLNAKLVERISTDVSTGDPMTILLNTSRLTAGVYTYTLEAPAGAITRRLTIVK